MRFSVIVPCYNAGPYIAEALSSIAAQTLPPHEIVVIDDGSTDNSLERIAKSSIPVKILHTNRAGCAGARLAGIKEATGDWLAFLDADDVWYPQHLERAQEILRGTSDVAYLAHLDCMYHDTGEVFAPSAGPPIDHVSTGLSAERFLEIFATNFYFSPSSVIQHIERVRDVGGPDPSLRAREDVDLFLRVIQGHTWSYNPERPWRYRLWTPGAMSANRMRCEQALLLSLLKNEPAYRGSHMSQTITRTARRVMAMAYTAGTPADQQLAWNTAWPRLPAIFRLFFWGMRVMPAPFRAIINFKRRCQKVVRW
jgi:glycosyltransferase involved in cell wall biosynthesis